MASLNMGFTGNKFVPHAHPECERSGCQFGKGAEIAAAAMSVIEQMGRKHMSQALWCDNGGHAFSERDPGRQRISIAVIDEDTEQERMESRDFCGEHAVAAGLTTRQTRPARQVTT